MREFVGTNPIRENEIFDISISPLCPYQLKGTRFTNKNPFVVSPCLRTLPLKSHSMSPNLH